MDVPVKADGPTASTTTAAQWPATEGGPVVDGGAASSGARTDGLLDLAGLALIALAALVCGALALVGYSPAAWALPFLVGALIGDGLVYLAVRSPRYRTVLVVLAIFLVAASTIVRLDSRLGDAGFPLGLPWEVPGLVEKLCAGVLLGFGGYVLWLVVAPALDAPRSWTEAVEERRELVRRTLVVGGILLALVVLAALLFGALALMAYVVGNFSG